MTCKNNPTPCKTRMALSDALKENNHLKAKLAVMEDRLSKVLTKALDERMVLKEYQSGVVLLGDLLTARDNTDMEAEEMLKRLVADIRDVHSSGDLELDPLALINNVEMVIQILFGATAHVERPKINVFTNNTTLN